MPSDYVEQLPINTSFSAQNPRLQLAHDSTSIKAGKKCWRYYEYSIIEGYVPIGNRGNFLSGNDHITFGWLFHAACELYDRKLAEGLDHDTAQLYVLEVLLYNTFDFVNKVPWLSAVSVKSRKTLLRTFILYTDKFEHDTLKTIILNNGKPAVELSFRFESGLRSTITTTDCPKCFGYGDVASDDNDDHLTHRIPCTECNGDGFVGEEILLCGHIDKMVEFNDQNWIEDKKSTRFALDDNYFEQYSPDIQVTLYTLAGKSVFFKETEGLIIDGCQVLVNGTRFRRAEIYRDPEHLDEFMKDFKRYIHDLELCVAENYFPLNPEACGFGNLQCRYRKVCSTAPSNREDLLKNYFTRRIWDPLQVR